MKITELRNRISKLEHGKVQVDIAQIGEVLRCLNDILGGAFYPWVRKATLMGMKVSRR